MIRILFIQKIWVELLGVMSISAVLKKNGHRCDLLISSDKQKIIDYIESFHPHVIGFHCVTGQHKWVLELSEIIKRRVGYKIIIIYSQIIKAARISHKVGLKFVTQNMLGLPGETLENAFETLELNWKIKPDHWWCSVFQPYPSTNIVEYAL